MLNYQMVIRLVNQLVTGGGAALFYLEFSIKNCDFPVRKLLVYWYPKWTKTWDSPRIARYFVVWRSPTFSRTATFMRHLPATRFLNARMAHPLAHHIPMASFWNIWNITCVTEYIGKNMEKTMHLGSERCPAGMRPDLNQQFGSNPTFCIKNVWPPSHDPIIMPCRMGNNKCYKLPQNKSSCVEKRKQTQP